MKEDDENRGRHPTDPTKFHMNLHYTEEMLRLLSSRELRICRQYRENLADADILGTVDVLEEDSDVETMGVDASIQRPRRIIASS